MAIRAGFDLPNSPSYRLTARGLSIALTNDADGLAATGSFEVRADGPGDTIYPEDPIRWVSGVHHRRSIHNQQRSDTERRPVQYHSIDYLGS